CVLSKRQLRAFASVVTACRLVLMPFCSGHEREQTSDLICERRRGNRSGQDSKRRFASRSGGDRFLSFDRRSDRAEKRRPGDDLSEIGQSLRTIRIVKPEDRGLREHISRPEARGMVLVAFNLCRSALV